MSRRFALLCACAIFGISSSLLTACGGPKQAKVEVPPAPALATNESVEATDSQELATSHSRDEDAHDAPSGHGKPLLVETGLASWYGAPYNHRRSSNGENYNMHAMTAAHRTLPLGSTVRVTNLKTGHSAVVEITDRGPFVSGRILDLSQAAAKKVDVWGAGVAMVRLEVLRAPAPLNSGGRWAVQIGAFEKEHAANKLKDHLSHRYQTAKVQCFGSPVGDWWVRVRVQDDDRKRAEEVARDAHTSEGDIFLVRLD
jgi:peptidoglycan lytic transglycosylase